MDAKESLGCESASGPVTAGDTLWSGLRALPRPAWILFLGTFLNKFGTFVVPFLTLYLTGRGYTVGQAGLAVGAYGIGNLTASLLGGHLADRIGRRQTIVLSMFSGAATMLLLSQARGFFWIVALTTLLGLTIEAYRPASSALLADVVPAGRRVTAFAALRAAFNAGFAFGPATAGFLAAFGYFWLFAGDATTSALFGLVALLALPVGAIHSRQKVGWTQALSVMRRDRHLQRLLMANFAIGLIFFQMGSTYGLYVTHLGFSPAVYGAVLSLNGALVVFLELPLTAFTRRYPPRQVMAAGYLICGAGFGLNALARSAPALVLCMVVFTLGEMTIMPTAGAYLADLAPPALRGRYMGISGVTWALALVMGPFAGMKLFAAHPGAYWLGCASLGLLAALVIMGLPAVAIHQGRSRAGQPE